jgi:Trk-type K+ transport system membrane component
MNPRMHRRFDYEKPIIGRLQINEINGKSVDTNYCLVEIINISMGGLCFVSNLNFPISEDLLVKITHRQETVKGHIVWKDNKIGNYLYGFKITSSTLGYLKFNYELVSLNSMK